MCHGLGMVFPKLVFPLKHSKPGSPFPLGQAGQENCGNAQVEIRTTYWEQHWDKKGTVTAAISIAECTREANDSHPPHKVTPECSLSGRSPHPIPAYGMRCYGVTSGSWILQKLTLSQPEPGDLEKEPKECEENK